MTKGPINLAISRRSLLTGLAATAAATVAAGSAALPRSAVQLARQTPAPARQRTCH